MLDENIEVLSWFYDDTLPLNYLFSLMIDLFDKTVDSKQCFSSSVITA